MRLRIFWLFIWMLPLSIWAKSIPYFYSVKIGQQTSYILGSVHIGVSLDDLDPKVKIAWLRSQQVAAEITDSLEGIETSFSSDYIYGLGSAKDLKKYGVRHLSQLHTADRNRLIQEFYVDPSIANFFHYDDPYCTQVLNARHIFTKKRKHLDLEIIKNSLNRAKPVIALENDLIRLNAQRFYKPTAPCTVRDLLKMTPAEIAAQDSVTQYKNGNLNPEFLRESEKAFAYRHAKWLPKIMELLNKPTFIVVGAYHLMGPESILKLLEDRGYEISEVSSSE